MLRIKRQKSDIRISANYDSNKTCSFMHTHPHTHTHGVPIVRTQVTNTLKFGTYTMCSDRGNKVTKILKYGHVHSHTHGHGVQT